MQTSEGSRRYTGAAATAVLVLLLPAVAWADPMCTSPFQSRLCLIINLLLGLPFVVISSVVPLLWWWTRRQRVTGRAGYIGLFGGLGLAVVGSYGTLQLAEHLGFFHPYWDRHPIFLYCLLITVAIVGAWVAAADILGRKNSSRDTPQ